MSASKKPSISVVMPTYNGLEVLKLSLPSLLEAFEHSGVDGEILVMENASNDGSAEFVKREFPMVTVVERPDNDPLAAYNEGIDMARGELVTFTNNDMVVTKDYLESIYPHFDDPKIFAVTSRVFEWDRTTIQGYRRVPKFSKGRFWYLPDVECESAALTIHATGGQSVFRRSTLLELDKFDMLFYPVYHEDLDLTYRAYKRGFQAVYEPRSIVYHIGGHTSKKLYSKIRYDSTLQKNLLLFTWKNIHDPGMIFSHIAWAPVRFLQSLLKGNAGEALGYFKALKQLPECLKKRSSEKKRSKLSDKEILSIFD